MPANAIRKTFIVTGYYSPLKGQSWYAQGNYAAEIKMNGKGTNGASGKPVHAGMIAAPKTYAFGTRIRLDGMGDFTVEDRGGAIVRAGQRGYEHDRIDIWMGRGEPALNKAMQFGKREVSGWIIP